MVAINHMLATGQLSDTILLLGLEWINVKIGSSFVVLVYEEELTRKKIKLKMSVKSPDG